MNDDGELGNGSLVGSSSPVAVSGARQYTALSAGWAHTCALTSAGAAWCWGTSAAAAGACAACTLP